MDLFGIAVEAESNEVGEEIALERDPITGEWGEMKVNA